MLTHIVLVKEEKNLPKIVKNLVFRVTLYVVFQMCLNFGLEKESA